MGRVQSSPGIESQGQRSRSRVSFRVSNKRYGKVIFGCRLSSELSCSSIQSVPCKGIVNSVIHTVIHTTKKGVVSG